jgi:CRP-like cAMP-binding protein
MRSAAIRVLLLVILALGGVASSAAMAGAQVLDPIGTVTSAISTITSQTTVVSDLTGSVTGATSGDSGATDSVSGATDAVSGATDAVSGSGALFGSGTTSDTSSGADGGSGSASSGDASSGSATDSNRGSPHTRFDRLPRRYESLLERIESGRHVRANIARLRALLASASPQLRARVMRFIRLEIRRLERGGLTRRERAAVQRLRTLLTKLQGQASRPAPQGPLSLWRVEGSGTPWATLSKGGVSAATAGSKSGSGLGPTAGRDEASGASPRLPLPSLPPSSDPPYLPLLLLVLAAIVCLVLLLAGPPRHLLPSPVRGMVEVRRPEVLALAVAIALGLVMGLVAVLLAHAVLL